MWGKELVGHNSLVDVARSGLVHVLRIRQGYRILECFNENGTTLL